MAFCGEIQDLMWVAPPPKWGNLFAIIGSRCPPPSIFKAACEHDLEGIVAKLASGRYEPEATTRVKIKNPTYSQAEGRADFIDIGAARQSR